VRTREEDVDFEEAEELGPDVWTRNSPFVGDRVSAGSFETATQVRFPVNVPVVTHLLVTTGISSPTATASSSRPCRSSLSRVSPTAVQNLHQAPAELSDDLRAASGMKLPEAQVTFRSILQALLLVAVSSDEEAKKVTPRRFLHTAGIC
jgi:coatomer protein complex subunit alpha (xenin)